MSETTTMEQYKTSLITFLTSNVTREVTMHVRRGRPLDRAMLREILGDCLAVLMPDIRYPQIHRLTMVGYQGKIELTIPISLNNDHKEFKVQLLDVPFRILHPNGHKEPVEFMGEAGFTVRHGQSWEEFDETTKSDETTG